MANGSTIDYTALIAQLLSQANGVASIETPQLGRVEFVRPAELWSAINLLNMAQAQASGTPTTGVIVATYDRGLGCPSNGGCC